MLGQVVVNQKGQVTIPSGLRASLGIYPNMKVQVSRVGDYVAIKKAESIFSLRGSVSPKDKPENFKKMRSEFNDYLADRKCV